MWLAAAAAVLQAAASAEPPTARTSLGGLVGKAMAEGTRSSPVGVSTAAVAVPLTSLATLPVVYMGGATEARTPENIAMLAKMRYVVIEVRIHGSTESSFFFTKC